MIRYFSILWYTSIVPFCGTVDAEYNFTKQNFGRNFFTTHMCFVEVLQMKHTWWTKNDCWHNDCFVWETSELRLVMLQR